MSISSALKSTVSALTGFAGNTTRAILGLSTVPGKSPKNLNEINQAYSESLSSSTKILGAIFSQMQKARAEELSNRMEQENQTNNKKQQDDKFNEELIKALSIRRKLRKPKKEPTKKEEPKPTEKKKEEKKVEEKKVEPKPQEKKVEKKEEVKPPPEKVPVKEVPKKVVKPPPKEAPKEIPKPTAQQAAPPISKSVETAVKISAGAAITAAGAFTSADSFAKTMQPEAERASKALGGVSVSALLGQWALESGWGKNVSGDFNYFGIKADPNWKGDKKLVTTREVFTPKEAQSFVKGMPGREIISQNGNNYKVLDWFRSYKSISEAVDDKVNFLKVNKRYSAAGVFETKTPEEYFSALFKAKYATDPNYVSVGVSMADSVDKKLKKLNNNTNVMPSQDTGTQLDQSSKENKNLKSPTTNKSQTIVNNTMTPSSESEADIVVRGNKKDDRSALQRKTQ